MESRGGGRPKNERIGEMAQSVKYSLYKPKNLDGAPQRHVKRLDATEHMPAISLLG